MPDNLKRHVTRSDIVVLILVVIFFGLPFYAATVLRGTFPDHWLIALLFDSYWKRIFIVALGTLICWRIIVLMDSRKKKQ